MNMRFSPFLGTVLLGILILSMPGCAVRRVAFNEPITAEQLRFIRLGETTLQQVVERLGPPEDITMEADQLIAEFRWSTTRSASLNLGYLFRLISPVSPTLTLSGTGININHVQFLCDKRLTVHAYAFGKADEHAIIEFWPF
ncbi:MAG: hypothetical protein NHB36_04155 [Nitrospira sp.]|nr:hypothetical protein [Nitrospira sp.]